MKNIIAVIAVTSLIAAAVSASGQVPSGAAGRTPQTGTVEALRPRPVKGPEKGPDTRHSTANDALFAAAAADGGLAELRLSELGARNATDPELKRFSEKMIDEHNRLNTELWSLAGKKGLTLPTTSDYRAQFCAQSLAGLSGEQFDRAYAKAQLAAHMESVAMFEAEASRGGDREIAALASRGLVHIKEHRAEIKRIAKKYMTDRD